MSKKEPFRIHIAAYLVLKNGGQILLLKRANTGYQDGKHSLVAGHLDGNEKAKQCIIREAEEEAGIGLRPEDLEVAHVLHRFNPDREYIDIYLVATKWNGEIKNMEPEKCSELKWYPIKDLPDTLLPDVKFSLNQIENEKFYGEFGW